MAKLVAVRLSKNSENTVEIENGVVVDGQSLASVSEKGKTFVVLEFVDDENPFKHSRAVRPYWMNGEGAAAKWAGAPPADLNKLVGKTIPGKFVTMPVSPYEITNADGTKNMAGVYTTFVMPHENAINLFTKAGHFVLDEQGTIIAEPKSETVPAEIAQ